MDAFSDKKKILGMLPGQQNQPVNSLGEPVQGVIDNNPQQEYYMAPWANQQQEQPQQESGYLDAALRGAKAQAAGALGGQADFVSGVLGTDGEVGDALQGVMQRNNRKRNYTFDDITKSFGNAWQYATDPEGLAYDVGGGFGSSGVLGMEGLAIAAALPASVTAGIGTGIAGFAARHGIPWLGKVMSTPAGKALIGNILKTPLEGASEGGNVYREMTHDEYGNPIANADKDAARRAMYTDAAMNSALLTFTNTLESMGLGSLIAGAGGKNVFMRSLKGAVGEFMQNGFEEGAQQGISQYTQGKGTLGQIVNPLEWSDDQKTEALIGGITGLGQGAIMTGGGTAINKILGNNTESETAQPEENSQPQETAQQEPELEQQELGSNDLVNRVRALKGQIPFYAEDGTNCMRTMGIALAGTPYEGQINVDQAIATATELGQLMDPETYTPRPGDLAVNEDGDHIVMVTENGGTIQNGKSANGVYESDNSAAEMSSDGKVKYYIRTSDYSNGGQVDTSSLGRGNETDYVDEYLNMLESADNGVVNPLDTLNTINNEDPQAKMFRELLENSQEEGTESEDTERNFYPKAEGKARFADRSTPEQRVAKATAEVAKKTQGDFAVDRALDALQAENNAQMRANRRTDFATRPFMPSTYDTNPRGTAGFRNLAEAERDATGRVNTATLSPEELARTQDIADDTRGKLKVRDMIDRIRGERAQAKQQALDYEWMEAEHERNTKGVANADEVRNNPAPNVLKAAQSRAMQDVTQRAMAGDHGAQRTFDRMGKAVKAYLMQREIDRLTNESNFENQLAATPDRATEPFMPAAYEKLRKEGRGGEYENLQQRVLDKKDPKNKERKERLNELDVITRKFKTECKVEAGKHGRGGIPWNFCEELLESHKNHYLREFTKKVEGLGLEDNVKDAKAEMDKYIQESKAEYWEPLYKEYESKEVQNNENESKNEQPQVNETRENNNENSEPEQGESNQGQASESGKNETNLTEQTPEPTYTRDDAIQAVVDLMKGKNLYDGIATDIPAGVAKQLLEEVKTVEIQDPRDYSIWQTCSKKLMLDAIDRGDKVRLYLKRYGKEQFMHADIGSLGKDNFRCQLSVDGIVREIYDKAAPGSENVSDVEFIENEAQNGLELKFPGKPDDETLAKVKGAGFRWSSRKKVWYVRKTNQKAMDVAKELGYNPEGKNKPNFDKAVNEDKVEEAVKALTSKVIEEEKKNGNDSLSKEEVKEKAKEIFPKAYDKDAIDIAVDKVMAPTKTGNAVDDFLNQHVQVVSAPTTSTLEDLEKVKKYKKDFETKLSDLVKDFKNREFASEKAVRELEKEANDKLAEYESEATKDKVINRKTIDDIVNKAEDELNEVIKEQLKKAKENERPEFKKTLGEAKLNERLSQNGIGNYETETKRFVLDNFPHKANPFTVTVEDKTKDIVSGGVTLIYNAEVEESRDFATLEEAENFIAENSKVVAEESEKVVESKVDKSTKEEVENDANRGNLQNVPEEQVSEGLREDGSGRNAGRVRGNETGRDEQGLSRGVHARSEEKPSSGRRSSGESKTGERTSSDGERSSDSVPVRRNLTPEQKKNAKAKEHPGHNYTISQEVIEESQGEGFKAKTRFKNNVAAIRLIHQLETENRLATPAEQEILAKYIGWGGLSEAFNRWTKDWSEQYDELQQMLKDGIITREEYSSMERSTTSAFYTPYSVVKSIWDMVERFGFKGGRVLEPSMGTGNFFGIMPENIRSKSSLQGVEYDKFTGKIAKQLYQKANIEIMGFEETHNPENFYDLIISNVPFGEGKPRDLKYNKEGLKIHNYFFKKSVELARPGGLIVFVTSTGTMGKNGKQLRKLIGDKVDFVGAIRLPDNTFKGNAGTKVTSDLIILQKREPNSPAGKNNNAWRDMVPSGVKVGWQNTDAPINEYFKEHPEMLIGETVSDRYGNGIIQSGKDENGNEVDVAKELAERISKLPADIYKPVKATVNVNVKEATETYLADSKDRIGTYKVKDGKVYYKTADNQLVPLADRKQKRALAYVGLRDIVKKIMAAQISDKTIDKELEAMRKELNKVYDDFVKKFGYLHAQTNDTALNGDPEYGFVCGIERYDEVKEGKKVISVKSEKGPIFSQRTVNALNTITNVDSVVDGLSVSLGQQGIVDIPYIAKLTGKSKAEVLKELKGMIYQDPVTQDYVTKDEYLSGNVREKLEIARQANALEGKYKENIEALEKIVPENLTKEDITVSLGSIWVPPSDFQDFAAYMLGCSPENIDIQYNPSIGWRVTLEDRYGRIKNSTANTDKWGTAAKDADGKSLNQKTFIELLEIALNKKPTPKITISGGEGAVSKSGTLAATGKLEEIRKEFDNWIWSDKARTERLVNYYNNHFNSFVPRVFNGDHLLAHLTEHGYSVAAPMLRAHQTDAVWRIMQGNTLLAHSVGAGKTWTMQTAAMEMKRLGIARKPMFVIPGHMLQQFENEFRIIYPNARLLSISTDTLPDIGGKMTEEKRNQKNAIRQETLSRIAMEDWDGIIISHDMFKRIPMSPEQYAAFYQEELDELENTLMTVEAEKGKRNTTVKDLQAKKEKLEEMLKASANVEAKDIVIPFESLGIDQLFVDEADLFKNLHFTTMMGNVSGLANSDAQRSTDMYIKTRYLSKVNNGRGVCFATGTPVSNSLAEEFTMLRYLAFDRLQEMGLQTFDAWASAFTKQVEVPEVNPSGSGFRIVKKLKFSNGGDLMRLFRSVADVKRPKDLNLKVPKLKNGKRTVVELPLNEAYEDFLQNEIWPRAEAIRNGMVDPEDDNMLKITSEQRLASLDMRLVKPGLKSEDADAKIQAVADRVYDKFVESKDIKGAQLVFCDLSTPKGQSDKVTENESVFEEESGEGIVVYEQILKKLVAKGIPKKQIAFAHDAKTKAQKEALFNKVRSGEIRVLIGSTTKMGAGTNCQDRLVALHHVDAPWRPRDIEQREGRIIRQGNMNDEVEIFTYVTKGSFDESMWGRIAYKSEVIEQAMSDDFSIREFDDIGPETLSYADIQAIASGNPLLAEQTIINSEVTKLLNIKAAFESTQRAQRRELAELPATIKRQTETKKNADADVKATIDVDGENFSMEIGSKTYTTVKEATEAFEKLAAGFNETIFTTIGKIGHYTVKAKLDSREYVGDGKYKNKLVALLVGNGTYGADGSVAAIKYRAMHAAKRLSEEVGQLLEDNIKKQKDLEKEVQRDFPQQAELEEKQRIQQNIAAQIDAMTVNKNVQPKVAETVNVDPETGEIIETNNPSDGQASLGDTDVVRSYEEVLEESIKAFPGAKIVREGGNIFAKFPNGPRIRYNIVDEIIVSAEELGKVQKAHNSNDANVQGYFELDKNGVDYILTVSRKSQKGTAYHEALHAAMRISLTDKENTSLINYYSKNANGKNVKEVIGDAYRDWRVAREEGRGSVFGKLFQKVTDFCTRVAALFNEGAKAKVIFMKIESGETNARKVQNRADNEGRQYSVGDKQPQQRTVTRQELQREVEKIVPLKVEKGYRSDAYKMYNRKANVGFVHAQGSLNELNSILGMYVDTQKKLSDNSDLRDELLKNAWDYQQDQKKARKFANAEVFEQVKEGAAYFGRLYATDKEQAKALFPKYYAAFEKALSADKALKAKVDSYLDTAVAFYKQTPEGKAKAGLTQLEQEPKTWKEKVKSYAKQAYVDWFDDKDVLRRVEREIETITGEKIGANDSAYFQARLSGSSAASRVDMVVNGAKTKWGKTAPKNSAERKAWYKALNEVYRGAWKYDVCYQDIVDKATEVTKEYLERGNFKNGMDALGSYLLANRFLEIWETKPDYKASMSKETARKVVENAPKAIKEAADLYYKFDDNLIGVMNREGMLSDEGLQGMRKYTRYCPLFRDFADEAAFDKFMSKLSSPDSYINLSNGIKALTEEGSDRTVLDDPTKSMLRMAASILGKVEKNKVGQKFVALSERSNVGQFVIPAIDPNTGKQLDTSNPQFSRFTVWENGEKKAYITLPEIYDVLENATHASAYAALLDNMIARGAASTLRKGATMSVGFMIRNFIKDTIGATVNSKNGFIPIKDSLRGINLLMNDVEFRNQYLASGANMAGYFKQDAKSLENMLDEMAGNGWWQKSSMLEKLHMMWEHYEQFGELIEQGTRAGEFKKALEKNKSLLEAAIDAKEVTLDFSRAGSKGRQFNRIIPFFNAVLQGGDKMVRTAIENPQKTMAVSASLALATMLLWGINHDEDWYKELDNESKYSNWHFHVGGKHIKIPKPQEFGLLTCASVEAALEQMFAENPKAMRDWASQFVENMKPSLLPALYRPILEVCANYDYHFQSDIVGKKYQKLAPEAQINSNTSEFAKLAGSMAGYSPIKIDHLIRGYFGGAGAFVARIPNKVMADGGQPAKYWNEMPIINEFVENDFAHSKSINSFYELLEAANKQHTTYGKKGQPSADVQNIRKYGTIISGLRKDIQKISASKTLSPERKRELIDNKNQRVLQVARKAISKYGNKYL